MSYNGRPTSLTPELLNEAEKLAKAGIPKRVIAEALGIGTSTFFRWQQYGDPDWKPKEGEHCPADRSIYLEFRDRIDRAQARPVMICEATMLKAAQGDPKNGIPGDPKVAEKWLRLHRPDLYRESSDLNVEVSGSLTRAVDDWQERIEKIIAGAEVDDD